MADEPRVLGGRYELAGQLGRGGMATVRRARDLRLGRQVAVKLLRIDLAGDPTFQARFRREAQASAGLNHPNIVSVYDTGEEQDPATGVQVPFIVMELVEGHTLREILRDGRKILPSRAMEFTAGVLDALSYSHKAGIVHRDIKPANVMLTGDGTVKVVDFGIARAVADTSATMTQTAAVVGTAQYLSPEQARGETVDARSDIYSAGCLLYELLVGHPPFRGDSPVSVAYQHVRENPVPPSQIDPEITPGMDAITLKALAKDPAHRYQSATAMKNDITRLLTGQTIAAAVPHVAAFPADTGPTMLITDPATAPSPVGVGVGAAATSLLPATGTTATQQQVAVVPDERRRRNGWLWGVLAFLLVVGLGYGAYLLFNPQARIQMVEVPLVFDQRRDAAELALREAKLVPAVEEVRGADDSSVGRVLAQNPNSGEKVAAGSTVTITVNMGPEKATIPTNLVGKQVDDVEEILKDLKFTNVSTQEDPSAATAKPNSVLGTSPEGGSTVALDAPIVIHHAPGTGTVPNFYGLNKAGAQALASRMGFSVTFTEEPTAELPPGQVFKQTPAQGEVIKRSQKIQLVLALPPGAVPTPPTTPPAKKGEEEPDDEP